MNHVVIFAGGTGTRMSTSSIPKQFIVIDGKPIIIRTLEHFSSHDDIDDIVVVCIPSGIDHLKGLIEKHNIGKIKSIIPGGETGYDSIHNGIVEVSKFASDDDLVLICDGVRPMVSKDIISNCIEIAKEHGSAVPVVQCIDSVLMSEDGALCNVNYPRQKMYMTQAPQGYTLKKIKEAHDKVEAGLAADVTSSADLLISLGEKVHIFIGERDNIKVTTPEDLKVLKSRYYFERYPHLIEDEESEEL